MLSQWFETVSRGELGVGVLRLASCDHITPHSGVLIGRGFSTCKVPCVYPVI